MKKIKTITTFLFLVFTTSVNAQLFTFSGQLGYARPQGNVFKDKTTGDRLSSFGLGYDADILVCFDKFNNKLSAGVTYVGSVLFGSESSSGFDIGMYGLALYGIKGHYRLLHPDRSVSPYVSLGLGLSQFSTPDIYLDETLIAEGKSSFSLGVRPEIGFDLGGLLLSAAYFVPMRYSVESTTGDFSGSAGTFSISIGYRQYISLNDIGLSSLFKKNKDTNTSTKEKSISSKSISSNFSTKKQKDKEVNDTDIEIEDEIYEEVKAATSASENKSNEKSVAKKTSKKTETVNSAQNQTIEKQITTTQNEETKTEIVNGQQLPLHNAESVKEPVSPSESRVSYENPNFKVGEIVLYKMRDRVYTATIISFIGTNIALVEMENGAEVKRYLKDLVKVNK
ncbi:MAG: hypothetical protein MJ197_01730 [Bacteroidales bacterium]|nr:hypothetical protein [Bacteroidales bacterium]